MADFEPSVVDELESVRSHLAAATRRLEALERRLQAREHRARRAARADSERQGLDLLTFQQFVERYPGWTIRQLRHLRFHAKRFGLEGCFVKLGRRVLVREKALTEALLEREIDSDS